MPTTTTPTMLMVLPTPTLELGPLWATEINAALTLNDAHDHSPNKGVRVTPAGLHINADLAFGNNNQTGVRSTRLQDQTGALAGAGDLGALYNNAGNLWWRNASGTNVQITSAGSVSATVSTVWQRRLITASTTIDPALNDIFLDVDTAGPRTLTLPAASAVAAGRYYVISDRTGQAETNAITLTPAGADLIDGVAASPTIITNYDAWVLVSDGTARWRTLRTMRELAGAAREGLVRMTGDFAGTGAAPTVQRASGAAGFLMLGPASMGTGAYTAQRESAGAGVGGATTIQGADGTGGGGPLILQSGTDSTANEAASGDLRFRRGTRTALLISGSSASLTLSFPMSTSSGPGTDVLLQAQSGVGTGRGGHITIAAGNATTSGSGGEVAIRSGVSLGAFTSGSIYLSVGGAGRHVQVVQLLAGGAKVVGLGAAATVTASQMPANSGDGVVWLGNADVAPTAGVLPVGGAIVYAEGGVPKLRAGSGDAAIGLDGTTYSGANTGGFAIPAMCVGYFTVLINGVPRRVPFFAT